MGSVIEALLAEDGIDLPSGGGADKSIRCFNPAHEDKTPSMCVNVVKNVYTCYGCGWRGNPFIYLTDVRNLSKADSMHKLRQMGVAEDSVNFIEQQGSQMGKDSKAHLPKFVTNPVTKIMDKKTGRPRGKAIAEHRYYRADGKLALLVVRYDVKSPKVLPHMPVKGGWRLAWPLNENIPEAERTVDKYILYRLPELVEATKTSGRQIWIVEGEKCADAVANMKGIKNPPPVTTLMGAVKTTNIIKADLEPLRRQSVLLISDGDSKSRNQMRFLGDKLHRLDCSVRYVFAPGENGYDIADAIAEGGWKQALEWIKNDCEGPLDHSSLRKDEDGDDYPVTVDPEGGLGDTDYFRVIGLLENQYLSIQSKSTWEIFSMPRKSLHTEGSLITLAPLAWWREMAGEAGLGRKSMLAFADGIIRAAESKGHVDQATQFFGRGANMAPDGRVEYNLGDKVLFEGPEGTMSQEGGLADSKRVYYPGASIPLKEHDNARKWGRDIYDSLMRYRWHAPDHGRSMCGWLVTAIIGGALEFRPAIWLNAPKDTGKTWLLTQFMQPFFGPMLARMGEVTEAYLANRMRTDSLPLYIDEFEPRRQNADKVEAILSLIRLASSGDAERGRAGLGGTAQSHNPRFSVTIASIDQPSMNPANQSRFVSIRLARQKIREWEAVSGAILASCTPEKTAAVRTAIIRETPSILRRAKYYSAYIANEMECDQREALKFGAISAGVEFLSGRSQTVFPPSVAEDRRAELVEVLLDTIVRVDGYGELTLGECMKPDADALEAKAMKYRDAAARHGMRYDEVLHCVYVAYGKRTLKDRLHGTEWEKVDLRKMLLTLPRASDTTDTGKSLRVRFGSRQERAVRIHRDTLEDVGFVEFDA